LRAEDQAYLAPATSVTAELREKGSKFVARVSPVRDEAAARGALEEIRRRFPNATHHCWAWRLGCDARERASDDGEPAGTAGRPILQVLRGAEISDVLAVVVRWFGGTKLGKGGLARAYSGAARVALEGIPTIERFARKELWVEVPYSKLGAVKRLIHPPEVEIGERRYGEGGEELVLEVRSSWVARVEEQLAAVGVASKRVR
jgi:uncharacterized YigZ family protein